MSKLFARVGTLILDKVAPVTDAGACVPEYPGYCGCGHIDGLGYYILRYNCNGSCYYTSQWC